MLRQLDVQLEAESTYRELVVFGETKAQIKL